jgi:hypothetical protein
MTERQSEGEVKEGAERGAQYPADNLEEAIGMLERIRAAVGFAPAQRQIVAQSLGYKTMSGHASRRLGTLSHFDLIERAGRGAARISELGRSILIPTTETERRKAIFESAKRPNLYAALIAKYAGHALPTLLPNLLVREHGIFPSVAEAAAKTFRESMEFAGLLQNGVLCADVDLEETSRRDAAETDSKEQTISRPEGPSTAPVSQHPFSDTPPGFTIPLDNVGRMATMQIPLPVTKRDVRKIAAWLSYMSAIVEEDEEAAPDISAN